MMERKYDRTDCGIIVGRFQVPELHECHVELIETVRKNNAHTIIFLGVSPLLLSFNNPLEFQSRKQMILEKFPDVTVLYIKDMKSDELWSERLDAQIREVVPENQTVTLYGSRDSFLPRYHGKFSTAELVSSKYLSGTDIRNSIKAKALPSYDFRAGVIWASFNKFKQTFHTVDIAIFNENETEILLARKVYNDKWQFIGGFTSPESGSDEEDARREVAEETKLEITDLAYVGSCNVNDWRYVGERDKIRTSLFRTKKLFGREEPSDDLAGGELKWFKVSEVLENLDEMHKPLFKMLTKTN